MEPVFPAVFSALLEPVLEPLLPAVLEPLLPADHENEEKIEANQKNILGQELTEEFFQQLRHLSSPDQLLSSPDQLLSSPDQQVKRSELEESSTEWDRFKMGRERRKKQMIDERALILDIESGMDAIDQWMQV